MSVQAHNRIRDYYAEEVEFLLSCGESPRTILDRLGVTAANLERALQRAERHDLARRFGKRALQPGRGRHKRGQCVDCGTSVWDTSERCRPCEVSNRWGKTA
jgi:hypothetical protein